MGKETSPKLDPIPPFEINIDRDILWRVGTALGDCNIDGLKTNEIRHVVELIAHLISIEDLAPGLLRNMLSVLIPHYLGSMRLEITKDLMTKDASKKGLSDELGAIFTAAEKKQNKEELRFLMINYLMKSEGINQEEAIRRYADHRGMDEDSIRRSLNRAKNKKDNKR